MLSKKVKKLANHINQKFGNVSDHHDASLPICYLLPDEHDIVNKNIRIIDGLLEEVGLDILGIEGHDYERLDYRWLIEYITNEAKRSGIDSEEIARRVYSGIRSTNQIMKYTLHESQVTLFGLEEPELFRNSNIIIKCNQVFIGTYETAYKAFKSLTENFEGNKTAIREYYQNILCTELDKNLMPLIKQLTVPDKLPHYKQGIEEFSHVTKTHFYQAGMTLHEKYVVLERSLNAVDLALKECNEFGHEQIAIQYGKRHISQMQDELKKKNISYITINN